MNWFWPLPTTACAAPSDAMAAASEVTAACAPACVPMSAVPPPAETVEVLAEKIVALIEKSHCFFAELLEKFPRMDFKTVASAVARLYEEGKINQDKDGKFELKG